MNVRPDILPTEVDDLINIDNSIIVCSPTTDADVVAEIQEQTDEVEEQFIILLLNEGLNAKSVLRNIEWFKIEKKSIFKVF